jgi:hypothetical protein
MAYPTAEKLLHFFLLEDKVMNLLVERVDVWAASIQDEPGGLAAKLDVLVEAGADLDFVIARRAPDKPGTGVVFVTPLRGDAEVSAAAEVGFALTQSLHSLRLQGDNQRGLCARMTKMLGDAGINLRGLSAAVLGTQFIMYIAMDTAEDTEKAEELLKQF